MDKAGSLVHADPATPMAKTRSPKPRKPDKSAPARPSSGSSPTPKIRSRRATGEAGPRETGTRALSPEDWALAALEAMGEGGLEAVSVEAVARRLGVTKGSFYWHFADRAALLRAALEQWERTSTDGIIAQLEPLEDPRRQLTQLLKTAFGSEHHLRIEAAITAAADQPAIRPIVERASTRRLEYLVALYKRLGKSPAEARSAGLLAYSAYVGIVHVLRTAPDQFHAVYARRRYLDYLTGLLLPRASPSH
jgi:AcrR family transcriptional regulator